MTDKLTWQQIADLEEQEELRKAESELARQQRKKKYKPDFEDCSIEYMEPLY